MSTKKKVGILFTGGTISMTIDKEIGANVPTLSGEQIMSMATNVKDVAEFEIKDFDEIPGPHMTPEKLLHLKDNVLELLNREDICGVVITHGTDSLEESAYFLDLVVNHEKPVVVTGAMRSSSELGYDGSNNFNRIISTYSLLVRYTEFVTYISLHEFSFFSFTNLYSLTIFQKNYIVIYFFYFIKVDYV